MNTALALHREREFAPATVEVTASAWLEPLLHGEPLPMRRLGGIDGRYVYFAGGRARRVVAVEAPGGLELPIGITAPTHVVCALNRRSAIVIGDGGIAFDGGRLRVRCLRGGRPALVATQARVAAAGEILDAELARGDRPWALQFVGPRAEELARAMIGGPADRLPSALDGLIGLGPGSTPSGDDVVAGAISTLAALDRGRGDRADRARDAHRSLAAALAARLVATTPLSAELLACAAGGHMLPRLEGVLTAAIAGRCTRPAMDELRRVGHDSGYFLATGAALALRAAATLHPPESPDAGPC